ncbi:MAG: type II secretion system GspH family protein [Leptospirales bacterium]|nr:type II secretion system GspH family protein [Leptospirales bacterium]
MGNTNKIKNGFTLIELLIVLAILSVILTGLYSTIALNISSIKNIGKEGTAIIIAKTKLNEFKMNRMRGPDFSEEPVDGYDSFLCSRITSNFEHPLLGMANARRTEITVLWKENEKDQKYAVSFIYVPR